MSIAINSFQTTTGFTIVNTDRSVDEAGEPTLTPSDTVTDERGRVLDTSAVIADFEATRLSAALAPGAAPAREVPSFDPHNPEHYTYTIEVMGTDVGPRTRCDWLSACDDVRAELRGTDSRHRFLYRDGAIQANVTLVENDVFSGDQLGWTATLPGPVDPSLGPYTHEFTIGGASVELRITPNPIEFRRASRAMVREAAGSTAALAGILDRHFVDVESATEAVDRLTPTTPAHWESFIYRADQDARYRVARMRILALHEDSFERRSLVRRFNAEVNAEVSLPNRETLLIPL